MRSSKKYKSHIITATLRILFLVLLFTQLRAGRVCAATAESASAEQKIVIEADLIAEDVTATVDEPAAEEAEAAQAVEDKKLAGEASQPAGEDSEPAEEDPVAVREALGTAEEDPSQPTEDLSDSQEAPEFSCLDDLLPHNGIPLVIIRINEGDGNPTIDEMNGSKDHSVKCAGTVEIRFPEV